MVRARTSRRTPTRPCSGSGAPPCGPSRSPSWAPTSRPTAPTAPATAWTRRWNTWGGPSREYIGQHRDGGAVDDNGWYAQGTYRVLPWVQLVLKQEDFRRSEISEALRNRATTGGVNVEFGGGKVRLLADYVSRKIGTPGTRKSQLITQAQVKF